MNAADARLVDPGIEWEAGYREMAAEYREDRIQVLQDVDDFAAHVQRLRDQARGVGLAKDYVPANTYWLVRKDGRVLGLSNLRHRLTSALEDFGGHIGYGIRPSERRKGYGTLILGLTLEKARGLGLGRVLLTCDPENVGSARIIQSNGGVLASESYSEHAKRVTSRYWIELGRSPT